MHTDSLCSIYTLYKVVLILTTTNYNEIDQFFKLINSKAE